MKYFDTKSAMTACYYLIAIDGPISQDELAKYDEIGNEIDPEKFNDYKAELIAECKQDIEKYVGREEYDEILQEKVDAALDETDIIERISTRLVIWNMMVLSFSDDEFSEVEKNLIKHIARITGVENSVLLEMEQILKAYQDVVDELEWIQQSNRPYTEIRPHVDEIEKRKHVLLRNATELIADEVLAPIPEDILKARKKQEDKEAFEGKIRSVTDAIQDKKEDITDSAKKALEASGVKQKAEDVGKKMKDTLSEKGGEAAKDLKKGAGKLFHKFSTKLKELADDSDEEGGDK